MGYILEYNYKQILSNVHHHTFTLSQPHQRRWNPPQNGITSLTQDPYIKILFGGHEYKTSICEGGGKNPTFSEAFSMVPAGDPNMHVQVWDSDMIKDDIVGEGTFNLRLLENRPNMRSENGKPRFMQSILTFSMTENV